MRHVFHITFYVFPVLLELLCWVDSSAELPPSFLLVSERARWLHGLTASDHRW